MDDATASTRGIPDTLRVRAVRESRALISLSEPR
jgi:hypothetical protein